MKKNILLVMFTTFLLTFISVAYAAFNSELSITGEGTIQKDEVAPTCGTWYLRDSNLTIQEASDQNVFKNPTYNTDWTSTNQELFIECLDNMNGSYGCINVTEITDSNNNKRYFKDVKLYNNSIKTDSETVTVTLQDAYLNERTCTLPAGGSNPYLDKQAPEVTITPTAANKFTYSATDDIEVLGYMVTDTQTQPDINSENWISEPEEVTIDNNEAKTYYVWAKDGENVSAAATISSYLLTKNEMDGTTLTIKYNDNSGVELSTGYVLENTPIYIIGSVNDGYNSIILKKEKVKIQNGSTQIINNNTTINAIATPNIYTLNFDKNYDDGGITHLICDPDCHDASGSMSAIVTLYNTEFNLPENNFIHEGYVFNSWNTASDGNGITYSNGELVSKLTTNTTITLYAIWDEKEIVVIPDDPVTMFDTGQNVNVKLKKLAGGGNYTYYYTNNTSITSIIRTDIEPTDSNKTSSHVISSSSSLYPIYAWYENGIIYYWSEDETIYLNTSASNMFYGLKNVTSIDLTGVESSRTTQMNSMFYECNNLSSIDITNFETSYVTTMASMFYNCNSLTDLDISNFDTSRVTSMYNMFYNCNSLTDLDISEFNTSEVTNMSYMFYNCSSLTSLDVSEFNTSKVTDMSYMFNKTSNITLIDLSNFDFSAVTTLSNFMTEMNNLLTIKTPKKYNESLTINLPGFYVDSNENDYNSIDKTSPTKTILTKVVVTMFDTGQNVNVKLKKLSGSTSATYSTQNTNITTIVKSDTEPDSSNKETANIISSSNSVYPIYAWFDNGTIYWWSESPTVYLNSDSSYLYNNLSNLINVDNSNYSSKYVLDMSYMFNGCSSLTSLNITNLNTENVINMARLFSGCTSLIDLDLSHLNTNNVTDMTGMFANCSSIVSLDLSNFNTSKVTSISDIFSNCSSIVSLDLISFDISNVYSNKASNIFTGMTSLERIRVPNFPTGTPIMTAIPLPATYVDDNGNYYAAYGGVKNYFWLYRLDVTMFDTGQNVNAKFKQLSGTASASTNSANSNITSILKSNIAPSNENKTSDHIISTYYSTYPIYAWFDNGTIYWWSEDEKIYLNSDSSYLFTYMMNLENIDLVYFDTSIVTNMSYMFSGDVSLTTLDLSGFDTTHVANMNSMFYNTSSITTLDLSNFIINCNVTNMLYSMTSLTSIKTPKAYLTNNYILSLPNIFEDSNNNIYLSLNTTTPTETLITKRNLAFFDKGQNVNVKLKKLSGSTSATYSTQNTNITTIVKSDTEPDSSNKETANIISSSNSAYPIYAWFDNGIIYWWSESPTVYLNEDSRNMFYQFKGLTNIDLTVIDSSLTKNMYNMFYGCNNLSYLDMSEFDLSLVENFNSIFTGMTGLTSIKTPKVFGLKSLSITLPSAFFDSSNNIYTEINEFTPTQTLINKRTISKLETGQNVNVKLKKLSGSTSATYSTLNSNILSFERSLIEPDSSKKTTSNKISASNSAYPIYAWFDNGIIYWWCEDTEVFLNENSSNMFYNFRVANNYDFTGIRADLVTNMSNMFYNNYNLTTLDLSTMNTKNTTNLSNMFAYCRSLTDLNLNNFITAKATNLSNMFVGCSSIETLDLSSFIINTSTTTGIFNGTNKLIRIKTPRSNKYSVSLLNVFYDSNMIMYSNLDSTTPTETWITSTSKLLPGESLNIKIKNLAGNSSATKYDINTNIISIEKSDTEPLAVNKTDDNIVSISGVPTYMWYDSGTIYYWSESIIFFNSDSSYLFFNLTGLKNIDISSIITNSITNTSYMFFNCSNLEVLDLGSFDMSNVTDSSNMLGYTSSLSSIKTPSSYSSSSVIILPTTFYDSLNNEYSVLSNGNPTETWINVGYTINYNLNNGNNPNPQPIYASVEGNVEIGSITTPTKTITVTGNVNGTGASVGSATINVQSFAGWTSSVEDGLGSNAKTGTTSNPSTTWDGTLTRNTYFKNLTDFTKSVTLTANYTGSITLPSLSKPGYECKWYTLPSGGIELGQGGDRFVAPSNSHTSMTVYAKCMKSLTFDNKTLTTTYDETNSYTFTNARDDATGGTGSYTYTITDGNENNYFTLNGKDIIVAANTPANEDGYDLKITATDNNMDLFKTARYRIIINRKDIEVPTCSSKSYNTLEQVLYETHTTGTYTNSELKGTNVGTYNVDLTPTSNYKWSSGLNPTSTRTITCEITSIPRWDGTTEPITPDGDIYEIENAKQLAWVSEQTNAGETFTGKIFKLVDNINMGANFDSEGNLLDEESHIYTKMGRFEGNFDGQNYTIYNLYIDTTVNYVGLFGVVSGSTLENFTVANSFIRTSGAVVGIIGGNDSSCLTVNIDNVKSINNNIIETGGVIDTSGIVGQLYGNITNCYNNSTVTSTGNQVAGIVSYLRNGSATNNVNEGNITTTGRYVGGIVGFSRASPVQENINNGNITGSSYGVGGIAGFFRESSIEENINNGNITGSSDSVGGIVGAEVVSINISNNINYGTIQGEEKWIGGIVGIHSTSISIYSNNKNYGDVKTSHGAFRVGGIIGNGNNGAIVFNNINNGDIDAIGDGTYANSYGAGGIVGTFGNDDNDNQNSFVYNNYNSGNVKARSNAGGIVGNLYDDTTSYIAIKNVINEGTVETTEGYAGGIVGVDNSNNAANYVSDFIENSYNSGTIKGPNAAGLVGGNVGIKDSITIGTLEGTNNYGVIGYADPAVNISNVYYPNTYTSSYGTPIVVSSLTDSLLSSILGNGFNIEDGEVKLYKINAVVENGSITSYTYTDEILQ